MLKTATALTIPVLGCLDQIAIFGGMQRALPILAWRNVATLALPLRVVTVSLIQTWRQPA
jgi:hypothetical protein